MDKYRTQIVPMICPVCGEFYFSELSEEELIDGVDPFDLQCRHCGWVYDSAQLNDINLIGELNSMSLADYKRWYENKLLENPKFDYLEANMPTEVKHLCPVCGEHKFSFELSSEICPVCGWEDNGFELNPDEKPSPGTLSFNEHKTEFLKQRKLNPKYKWKNSPDI